MSTQELFNGIQKENVQEVERCLNAGLDVEAMYNYYEICNGCQMLRTTNTPLIYSLHLGRFKIAKLLIDKGTNTNTSGAGGITPLMQCVEKGNLEMAKYLIDMDAITCKPDTNGETPLSLAVSKHNVDMIKLLLNNGAKFSISTSVLCKALRNRSNEITKILVQNSDISCVNSSVLCEAIRFGTFEIINFLLQNCTDKTELNGKDSDGDTPLIKSVRLGKFSTVKLLIQKGADVNHKDKKGLTALSITLSNLDFRTFQFLIESGADPNLAVKEIEEMAQKNGKFAAYIESLTKNNIAFKDVAPVKMEAGETGPDKNGFNGQEDAKKSNVEVDYL